MSKDKIEKISSIIIETINDGYRMQGIVNNLSEEEVNKIIQDNAPGLTMVAEEMSRKIIKELYG